MASGNFYSNFSPLSAHLVENTAKLLWGKDIKEELFRRWTQGFIFSDDEPTALIQLDGGPCAVIAPVQAYLLKNLLFNKNKKAHWNIVTEEEKDELLCMALCDMLLNVANNERVTLVHYCPENQSNCCNISEEQSNSNSCTENIDDRSCMKDLDDTILYNCSQEMAENKPHVSNISSPQIRKKRPTSQSMFHSSLRYQTCSTDNLQHLLYSLLPVFRTDYGVLRFLYSVLVTKGIDQIKNEIEEPNEPLIVGIHGHGSQSLVNLLLTGKAVSNVWDEFKDVSGLKLYGISQRSSIGFLTQMEHLRYCEVGWNLKNPKYPIWLLGSEMHITVLFSTDKDLLLDDNEQAEARKAFANLDGGGAGFISTENFSQLLGNLGLVSDPDYVHVMREKLDPEQLGIITLTDFLSEFFPRNNIDIERQTFPVFHYNGLRHSSPDNKVVYARGDVKIREILDSVLTCDDDSPIRTCLMTKWPTIEINWHNNVIPSLN